MTYIKTYKFRLCPTNKQEQRFAQWVGATRYVYNLCLSYKNTLYKDHGISITKNDLQKELKDIKNDVSWIGDVHSQVLQESTDRLYKAYDNFFRRVKKGETPGFPKFAKRDFWSSFTFKQGVKVHPNTNRVQLPNIGKVKFRKSQDIVGVIKTASVKREADGWYVCITAETKKRAYPKTDKVIGIDLGLKDLAIASDGYVFDNPRTLRKWSNKLSKSQKSLSRKKLGSNNRNKAKKELKSLHQKIARVRGDNLHKVTSQIINENQVIICEDLNTRGMLKNHKLAKSISDASWGKLTSMLEYKSKWADREFVKVSAHYTSQDCNNCGWRKSDLKLSDRIWTCGSCEQSNDRDINAAKNIRDKGIKKLSESGIAIKLQEKEAGHAFSTFGYIGPVRVGAEELIQTNRETLSGTEESHAL